jgi:hypothetical protein
MKKVINIDWLQINCKGILKLLPNYNYKILPYSTRVFKRITEVSHNNKILCTIASLPLSSVIPSDTNLIKFDNKVLYEFGFIDIVDTFVNQSGLKFKGITRIDLCCDFNYFDINMTGSTFIKNFVANKYYQKKRNNFKVQGRQEKNNIFEYLRLGSNTSIVSSYLYNKSREMQVCKFKQHIFDCWRLNGLDTNKDVWRLEFSLKSSQLEFINTDTGDIKNLTFKTLKNSNNINLIYIYLYNTYFKFLIRNNSLDTKDFKRLKLFNFKDIPYVHRIYTKCFDTNRADKVFIRKLENFNNELRSTKKELSDDLSIIKEHYIKTRNLSEYYYKKVYDPLVSLR